jgi:hypothetical protein
LATVGRALVDELLELDPKAAAARWQQIGPATRQLVIRDGRTVQALDAFFKPAHGGSAAELLRGLSTEPVQVFAKNLAGDRGVARLRAIGRLAPAVLPKMGRAVLDDLLERAKAQGGFTGAEGLWREWQRIGPGTKRLLFPDPGHVKDLDRLFLLAKRMAHNPNPSGTATLLLADPLNPVQWLAYPAANAAARLFYTPAGVQLLTRGLSIPVRDGAAVRAWQAAVAAHLGGAAGEGGDER